MARWSNSGGTAVNVDSLRLEPGRHRSPRDGVCLLELTSILAEEEFSDRPRCVCKVIAAFLRSWNDRSSHAQRQRLRPYATQVIGSRAGGIVTRRRRDICLIWAGADLSGHALSQAVRRLGMRLRIVTLCGIRPALRLNEGAGELAARIVFARYDSETGLRLIDTLLDVGTEREGEYPASGPRTDDALARAVVERALRDPVPVPHAAASANGNGNGHREEARKEPARIESP
jgi:hypothetical protein